MGQRPCRPQMEETGGIPYLAGLVNSIDSELGTGAIGLGARSQSPFSPVPPFVLPRSDSPGLAHPI